jgi:hypothetical protein
MFAELRKQVAGRVEKKQSGLVASMATPLLQQNPHLDAYRKPYGRLKKQ